MSRAEKTQDPESQLIALRAAATRFGWTVVSELSLKMSAWDSVAASEVRRQALAPIERGDADTLMVWAFDRYSREGVEGAFRELRHLEDHLGAAFYSLQEPFLSTAGADRQQRELMLSIIAWAARWESERRSQRVRAKLVNKKAHAEVLGQRARWARGQVATSADVARCRELSAQGRSTRRIAAELGISKSQVARLLIASAA